MPIRVVAEDVPPVLDYLESELPEHGFLFGPPGLADIAIACFLRNAAFARYKVDPLRWPRTATFVAAGAPVSADTLAGAVPRRGVPRGG
jgi:glutathione S-transferase